MSAWLVSQDHIAALVNAADRHALHNHDQFSWQHAGTRYKLVRVGYDEEWTEYSEHFPDVHRHTMTFDTLGQTLLDECLRSLWYRYPDDTLESLPGYMGEEDRSHYRHRPSFAVSVIATLKAIDCYEYQSCEHPQWEESCAHAFCQALRESLIGDLPGYDEAPWGLYREEEETKAVMR